MSIASPDLFSPVQWCSKNTENKIPESKKRTTNLLLCWFRQTRLFNICRDKSFWIWDQNHHRLQDITTKGYCCFNHICGLPTKHGVEKPIFDYEKLLYDSLLISGFYNPLKGLLSSLNFLQSRCFSHKLI